MSPEYTAHPEIATSEAMRLRVASAGGAVLPALAASWDTQPHLREGVLVTLGVMLWYLDGTVRALPVEDRITARRHLLRGAAAEEEWLRSAFVEAAECSHDATYLPLVKLIAPTAPTVAKLEQELVRSSIDELLTALREQWDAMCGEQWVDDSGLCRSVGLAFASARKAHEAKDARTARAALSALLVNIGASQGRGITPAGHAVMRGGLEAVLARF